MKARICILDYGLGNVGSVLNLFQLITADVVVSNEASCIRDCTHLVLPGVGAFGSSMARISSRLPVDVVEDEVRSKGKPFLGICVGMQVLAEEGLEFGIHKGLGWIPGRVEKLSAGDLPLPHIGWNDVQQVREDPLLASFEKAPDFYFVHSYVFKPACAEHGVAITEYGERFVSIVRSGSICGVQFHPEKSQRAGRLLLESFLRSS